MRKVELFTVFKRDGTKVLLYGYTIEMALDSAGYSLTDISETVADFRKGFNDDLKFINGKWHPKELVTTNNN